MLFPSASLNGVQEELFWCRAKFIVGSVAALREREGGGQQWLTSLRDAPYQSAAEALCTLPGVGPKVCCPEILINIKRDIKTSNPV